MFLHQLRCSAPSLRLSLKTVHSPWSRSLAVTVHVRLLFHFHFPFFFIFSSIINKCSTIFQPTRFFYSLFIRDKFVLFSVAVLFLLLFIARPVSVVFCCFILCNIASALFLLLLSMFYYLLDSVCFHLCIQCLVFCGSNGLRQINRYRTQFQIMSSAVWQRWKWPGTG